MARESAASKRSVYFICGRRELFESRSQGCMTFNHVHECARVFARVGRQGCSHAARPLPHLRSAAAARVRARRQRHRRRPAQRHRRPAQRHRRRPAQEAASLRRCLWHASFSLSTKPWSFDEYHEDHEDQQNTSIGHVEKEPPRVGWGTILNGKQSTKVIELSQSRFLSIVSTVEPSAVAKPQPRAAGDDSDLEILHEKGASKHGLVFGLGA